MTKVVAQKVTTLSSAVFGVERYPNRTPNAGKRRRAQPCSSKIRNPGDIGLFCNLPKNGRTVSVTKTSKMKLGSTNNSLHRKRSLFDQPGIGTPLVVANIASPSLT